MDRLGFNGLGAYKCEESQQSSHSRSHPVMTKNNGYVAKIPEEKRFLNRSPGPPEQSKYRQAEPSKPSGTIPKSDHPSRWVPALP